MGHVGAGKTSLLSTLLGELDKVRGQVKLNVSSSFCVLHLNLISQTRLNVENCMAFHVSMLTGIPS